MQADNRRIGGLFREGLFSLGDRVHNRHEMRTGMQISEADVLQLSPSPSVKRFGPELVLLAGQRPILDVACGGGRNSAWLAHLGGHVIGIDIDLRQIEAHRGNSENTAWSAAYQQVEVVEMDVIKSVWPYPPSSIGGIVNIHFLQESLLMPFSESIVSGGLLILETVEARGNNYLQLPKAGSLRAALESSFSFLVYKERSTGPDGVDAVTVQLIGKKRSA